MANSKSESTTAKKHAERTELRVLEERAALDTEDRKVLSTQASEAYLQELGSQTRSAAVLSESRSWIVPIQKSLVVAPAGLFYGDENFTYFLETVANLHDTLDTKKNTQVGAERTRGIKEANLTRLRRDRNQLLAALGSMARGNALLETEVDLARGTAENAAEVLTSTRDLIKLARTWLRKEARRARLAKLSAALVDAAEASVSALADATDQRRADGNVIVRDDEATNLAEGRVLFQMKLAMRAFESARERGVKVPKLVPGAGTKRVLAGKTKPPNTSPSKNS